MAQHATHGGTVYGPGYVGRQMTPDEVRNAPLRRRGLFGRRYAVKDVEEFLAFVAVDIESRMHHEEGLLRTIGQLRMQNEDTRYALGQWQSQVAQEMGAAQHPARPS